MGEQLDNQTVSAVVSAAEFRRCAFCGPGACTFDPQRVILTCLAAGGVW